MSSGAAKIALYHNDALHNYIKDNYLTESDIKNNPSMTHFKSVFRKKTNFSKEIIKQPFHTKIGQADNFHSEFKININRFGDLLHKMYLEIDVTAKLTDKDKPSYTVNHFINSLIKNYKIKIGNETIDEVICQWTQIKSELTNKSYDSPIKSSDNGGGNNTDLNFTSDLNRTEYHNNNNNECSIPLILGGNYNDILIDAGTEAVTKKYIFEFDFWFTRNIGSALPLFLLHEHDVELFFTTALKEEVIGDNINIDSTNFTISSINFYNEQYFLAEDEKKSFENRSTEYLIDTIQHYSQLTPSKFDNTILNTMTINLDNMKHPIKCLIWAIQNEGTPNSNKGQGPCYFTSMTNNNLYGTDGAYGKVSLLFNNKKYINELSMTFFTRKFTEKFCNNTPPLDRIGIYSFALNPFSLEPSGILNFSRVSQFKSNKELILDLSNNNISKIEGKKLFLFAVNYNILKIQKGKAALLYN